MRDLLISMPADADRDLVGWLNEEFATMDPNGLALDAFVLEGGLLRYEVPGGRAPATLSAVSPRPTRPAIRWPWRRRSRWRTGSRCRSRRSRTCGRPARGRGLAVAEVPDPGVGALGVGRERDPQAVHAEVERDPRWLAGRVGGRRRRSRRGARRRLGRGPRRRLGRRLRRGIRCRRVRGIRSGRVGRPTRGRAVGPIVGRRGRVGRVGDVGRVDRDAVGPRRPAVGRRLEGRRAAGFVGWAPSGGTSATAPSPPGGPGVPATSSTSPRGRRDVAPTPRAIPTANRLTTSAPATASRRRRRPGRNGWRHRDGRRRGGRRGEWPSPAGLERRRQARWPSRHDRRRGAGQATGEIRLADDRRGIGDADRRRAHGGGGNRGQRDRPAWPRPRRGSRRGPSRPAPCAPRAARARCGTVARAARRPSSRGRRRQGPQPRSRDSARAAMTLGSAASTPRERGC